MVRISLFVAALLTTTSAATWVAVANWPDEPAAQQVQPLPPVVGAQIAQFPPVGGPCTCQQTSVTLFGVPGAPGGLLMKHYDAGEGIGACVWSGFGALDFRWANGAWVLYRDGRPAYSSAGTWNACQARGTIVLNALPNNPFPGVGSVSIQGN